MDPVTVKLVLTASKLVIESSKRNEIIGRLNAIQSTLDQLILREIKSAYEAISDALVTTSEQTKNVRLNYAEESLLKNTNLDPTLKTGDFHNNYLMALANYGLAFVCMLRNDEQIAAKHLLRSYKFDPRTARTILTPSLYEDVFKPKCSDVFKWYTERTLEISQNECSFRVIGGKTMAVALWVGGVGYALAAKQGAAARAVHTEAAKIWDNSNPAHYRIGDMEDLVLELEIKLDDRCREIALDFLSEK